MKNIKTKFIELEKSSGFVNKHVPLSLTTWSNCCPSTSSHQVTDNGWMLPEISCIFSRSTELIMNITVRDHILTRIVHQVHLGNISNAHSWTSPHSYFEAPDLGWEPAICALKASPGTSDVHHNFKKPNLRILYTFAYWKLPTSPF